MSSGAYLQWDIDNLTEDEMPTSKQIQPTPSTVPLKQLHLGDKSDDKSRRAITIQDKTPAEVYSFWRNFHNLASFMQGVSEVHGLSDGRSHWRVELESGMKADWRAEILSEAPGEMISWRSLPDSQVATSGSVWFSESPDGQGTVVTLSMDYEVMGGRMSELATLLMGDDPDTLVQMNLRRLKVLLETGEIPTIEGQPSGREEEAAVLQAH